MKEDSDFKIGAETDITIPLRNFGIDERIMMLEHELAQAQDKIEANASWIDSWESDGILPLDVEQNEKIKHLEWKFEKIGF